MSILWCERFMERYVVEPGVGEWRSVGWRMWWWWRRNINVKWG